MGKRIMVVDDSRVTALQIKKLLENSDYEVVAHCRSGEEALEQYGKVQPDLVTMDIIMPGMDGLETVEALLEEHPEAQIFVVSSLAYDDTYEEAKALGAKGFIDKPITREQMLAQFEQALNAAE